MDFRTRQIFFSWLKWQTIQAVGFVIVMAVLYHFFFKESIQPHEPFVWFGMWYLIDLFSRLLNGKGFLEYYDPTISSKDLNEH